MPASGLPHTRLVYVADREADMIALMARAQELGTPADWLIRSTHDRAPPEGAKLGSSARRQGQGRQIRFPSSTVLAGPRRSRKMRE